MHQRFIELVVIGVATYSTLSLVGCNSDQASPEVVSFLTGMDAKKSYSSVSKGSSIETYCVYSKDDPNDNSNRVLEGTISTSYEFDKTDSSSFYWHQIKTFSGNQISGGVKKTEALLVKEETSYSLYSYDNNDVSTLEKEAINDDKAALLIERIFYIDEESYYKGGLYYGDIFKINTNNFPSDAFTLSDDQKSCIFSYKYIQDYGSNDDKLLLDQTISINKMGLIENSFQNARKKSTYDSFEEKSALTYDKVFTKYKGLPAS
jgi:hypothetical protein